MKKLLLLFCSMLIASFQFTSLADEGNGNTTPQNKLEIKMPIEPGKPHRTPININIEMLYNAEIHCLEIIFFGETEGEAYLYLGNDMIGYSNEINTTFQLPNQHGTYSIEIITESWTAHGAIEL